MRKEITETCYVDPDAFKSADALAKELKKFSGWLYHGLCVYEGEYDILRLKFTATRVETDEEMNTRLRREQEAAERKRTAAQQKLDAARVKAEKAAAEYAALEAEWDSLVTVKTKAFFGVED